MNWKLLTALKLTKTLRRPVLVYALNLFRLVIVLKLISDCLGFSVFFVGQSGLFLKPLMVTLITTMTSRNTLPLAKIRMCNVHCSLGQYSSYLVKIFISKQPVAISVRRSISGIIFYANRFSGLGGVARHTYIHTYTRNWSAAVSNTGDVQYQTCFAGFDNKHLRVFTSSFSGHECTCA